MNTKTSMLYLAAVCAVASCASGSPEAQAPKKGREATFDAKNAFDFALPAGSNDVKIWCVLPQDDPLQEISDLRIETPLAHEVTRDSEGNKVLYMHGDAPAGGKFAVVTAFRVRRWENLPTVDASKNGSYSQADLKRFAHDLEPNRQLHRLPLALRRHGAGRGHPDPHGVRGALQARARRTGQFGGLDERRVTFSTGRDITLSPPAAAGPVNHLPKCWVEVGGKPVAEKAGWTRKFTYRSVQ